MEAKHLVDRYPQSIKNQIASYLEYRARLLLDELVTTKRPANSQERDHFAEKAGAHEYLMKIARELKV